MILSYYIRKYRENGQYHLFSHFDPLNGIFHTIFAFWPQEGNTKDFLSQVEKVNIFFPRRGDCKRGKKFKILCQNRIFGQFDPPQKILKFMLIVHLDSKGKYYGLFKPSLEGQKIFPSQGETLKGAKSDYF